MKIITLIACAVISNFVYCQDFKKQKLDSLFSILDSNRSAMGSISIYKKGKEVYNNSIGYADIERNLRNTVDHKYQIGSITKTFTAAMIMQMIEEGKLSLNDKLSDYFPSIPNAEKITIEDLLRHRSGLINLTKFTGYPSWKQNPLDRESHLDKIKQHGFTFEPGERSEYSNTNYILLGFIAEEIDQKRYPEILKARITAPLNMNETYIGDGVNTEEKEARAHKKSQDWEIYSVESHPSVSGGAGAITSTPSDVNVFLTNLMEGELFSEELVDLMKESIDGHGLGIKKIPYKPRAAYGHTGIRDGFTSFAAYFPEENVSITYLSNGHDYPITRIVTAVFGIYFDLPYDLPNLKGD